MDPQSTGTQESDPPLSRSTVAWLVLGNSILMSVVIRALFLEGSPADPPDLIDGIVLLGLCLGFVRVSSMIRQSPQEHARRAIAWLLGVCWLAGLARGFLRQPSLFYFAALGSLALLIVAVIDPLMRVPRDRNTAAGWGRRRDSPDPAAPAPSHPPTDPDR
ncbi:MAG: hypothetical protein ABI743_01590 [bacterium]